MRHYSDYHRTVVAYHGTRLETARAIVLGEKSFETSRNDDDWLGHGIYFWEYAPQQAFLWARNRQASKKWSGEIAVLGSMIRLGSCFDLLDPENIKDLSKFYRAYTVRSKVPGRSNPRMSGKSGSTARRLSSHMQVWKTRVDLSIRVGRSFFQQKTRKREPRTIKCCGRRARSIRSLTSRFA